MWGLFVGAAAAVLAPVGPGALVPLKMAVAAADSVGGDVYVAVVVDFGTGSSMSTVSKCVPVPSNGHDADALATAVGSSNVTYAASGLLCSIDNYPANGVQNCGQSAGSGNYDYWSYWHGSTGSWVYANNGPAEQSVSNPANDVEGWRFQMNEPDTSNSPPPGMAPTYAQICNASTEVPPAGSTAPVASPTTTTTIPANPVGSALPATGAAATGSAPGTTPTTVGSRPRPGSVPTSTAPTTPSSDTPSTVHTTGSGGATGGHDSHTQGSSDAHRSVIAGAAVHGTSGGSSSGNALPVILVALVVVGLGTWALIRWRRRPAEE